MTAAAPAEPVGQRTRVSAHDARKRVSDWEPFRQAQWKLRSILENGPRSLSAPGGSAEFGAVWQPMAIKRVGKTIQPGILDLMEFPLAQWFPRGIGSDCDGNTDGLEIAG